MTALDFANAKDAWEAFEGALGSHAAREDAVMLPLFFGLGEPPRGASPEIMAGEHERLLALARDCGALLGQLAMSDGSRRQAVMALEQLSRVRHLFEHHGEREQKLVYPALDGLADDTARAAIAAALNA